MQSGAGELTIQRELQRGELTLSHYWQEIRTDVLNREDTSDLAEKFIRLLDSSLTRAHLVALIGLEHARHLARLFSSRETSSPPPYVAFSEEDPSIDYETSLRNFVQSKEESVGVREAQAFLFSEYHRLVDSAMNDRVVDAVVAQLVGLLESSAEEGRLRAELVVALKARIADSLARFEEASSAASRVVEEHENTLRTRALSRYAAAVESGTEGVKFVAPKAPPVNAPPPNTPNGAGGGAPVAAEAGVSPGGSGEAVHSRSYGSQSGSGSDGAYGG